MRFERIKNTRQDLDIKQVEMASYLHCSQQNYSDYENGKVKIGVDILVRIADRFDVSTDYLLNRSNNKTSHKDK